MIRTIKARSLDTIRVWWRDDIRLRRVALGWYCPEDYVRRQLGNKHAVEPFLEHAIARWS